MKKLPIDDKGDHVIVTFPEFGDALRTPEQDKLLQQLVHTKSIVIFDLSGCRLLDTPWVRLVTTLSKEGEKAGSRVAVVGANDELKKSTDLLGHRRHWHLFTSIDDAIAERDEKKP